MKISVVIPAYNEQERLINLLPRLKSYKLPVIVVDDGSTDKTTQTAKKYTHLVLTHRVNLGKGAALKTGVEYAFISGAEAVIVMDADGQHQVQDLVKFINALNQNYEVVIGCREFNRSVPIIRFLGNKLATHTVNFLFGIFISDLLCGYRAFTQKAYKKIKWNSSGYGVETEMVALIGKRKVKYCIVPVEMIYLDRFKGVTIFDALFLFGHVLYWRFAL